MAILTSVEFAALCPDSDLTGTALDAAILSAQSLMESPLGSNRSLEITQYTEALTVPLNARILLSYASEIVPLIEGSISVQIRGGDLAVFGLSLSSNQWRDLSAGSYLIDYTRAELSLQGIASGALYAGYSYNTLSLGYRNRRPTMKPEPIQARIVYQAGFDPDDTTNAELQKLKRCVAYMAQLRGGNDVFSKGVNKASLDGFYEVGYEVPAGMTASMKNSSGQFQSASLSDELLMIAKRYKPRSFAVS